MNTDQLKHKCGYCGRLFSFTNFIKHECFKHYVEDEDRICVDENYVVTICTAKTAEGPACKDTLDELLIRAVKERRALYDYTIPVSQRTNLRKNALWLEVSNLLGGALGPEEAKARWKYLRDNYAKARKKAKAYIPSGSAAKIGGLKKSKFRFYDLMTFLNDFLETRQTVSVQCQTLLKVKYMQHLCNTRTIVLLHLHSSPIFLLRLLSIFLQRCRLPFVFLQKHQSRSQNISFLRESQQKTAFLQKYRQPSVKLHQYRPQIRKDHCKLLTTI
ncbi:uncharacterized protein LOC143907448 isoform X2 [Temnothorax americanus]|uniref:uncharacterized protein LOC143907448 isoform X2 n=1 Tax=Temnothorax americanus TaxID=1964332 RepID=UPI0040689333